MPVELREFAFGGTVRAVVSQPGGHIHRSYRVQTNGPAGPGIFLVQQLNTEVFRNPEAVMANIVAVTGHIASLTEAQTTLLPAQRQIVLIPTLSGQPWHEGRDGSLWRAFPYVAGATMRTRVTRPSEAEAAGLAFGAFLSLMESYAGPPLTQSIPHFHDTAWYMAELDRVAATDPHRRLARAEAELRACLAQRALVSALPAAGSGGIRVRVVHNDAKLGNVLLDHQLDRPLAVIDLDTVMKGSAFADVGDLLRSAASPTDEDESDISMIRAEPALVEAVLGGWFRGAGEALTGAERHGAVLAGCVITLEQSIRFLTDYLAGDIYYSITDPDQNLRRTRAQLTLLSSLLAQRASFERWAGCQPTFTA